MNDANDNVVNPTGNNQPASDSVSAAAPFAGGDTPRAFPRQSLTGVARGIQQFGSPDLFVDAGNNYFGVSKDGIQQVLMGLQPTFGEGFYVTKDGIDASTANSADDFIFNSNQNVFKIVKTDIVTIAPFSSTVSTLSVAHGLNFAPIPVAFLTGVGVAGPVVRANLPLPTFINATIDAVAGVVNFGSYLYCAADDTNVYFQCLNATGTTPGTFQVRYYLLQLSSGRA